MKENIYLQTINKTLTDSSLLGDDCAFLSPDMLGNSGVYVTQDSLIEDVHFSLRTITPYQLGCKAIQVNLSDLCAACAEPLCVTISLSLPRNIEDSFIENFYKGVNEVCEKNGLKVAGGDLTGSDKIFISVTAIGVKTSRFNISRSNAKVGDVVLVSGFSGDSAAGLKLLQEGKAEPNSLIETHLAPHAQVAKSKLVSKTVQRDFAMMDTSDGLGDALFKIAENSDVSIFIEFDDIPLSNELKKSFPDEYKTLALWGGEDYELILCVDEKTSQILVKEGFYKIGKVQNSQGKTRVKIKDGTKVFEIDESVFSKKSFSHFGE